MHMSGTIIQSVIDLIYERDSHDGESLSIRTVMPEVPYQMKIKVLDFYLSPEPGCSKEESV